MLSGQEQIEQYTQRVHIRCRGNRAARHLFRSCKQRSQRSSTFLSEQCRCCRSFTREQFGDAEIQQLYLSIVSDEHVGGLEVAMNDQIGMGQGDSASHIEET